MTQCSIAVTITSLKELPTTELRKLSRLEIARAGEISSSDRRLEYLCGRAMLRSVLQKFTGEPASSHEIVANGEGKPLCVGGPAISIAHSGDLVVCAATDQGQIGVDVEIPDRRRDTTRIAKEYFAADEIDWLSSQPADRFYMLWVLKEAWLKAKGTGIAGGLDRLRCLVTPPRIEALISDEVTPKLSLHTIESALIGVATTTALQKNLIISGWDPVTGCIEEYNNAQLIATTV
jgi:phosphopantetheinyl transferase